MDLTLFFPHFAHPAIEERYGMWQSRLLLQRGAQGAPVIEYDGEAPAAAVVANAITDYVLVVTDPLLVAPPELPRRLMEVLSGDPDPAAVLPVTNESSNPRQVRTSPVPYLTLRQFEDAAREIASEATLRIEHKWDGGDPGIYLARRSALERRELPLRDALTGEHVAIATNLYVHRFPTHRGQVRSDLLERVSTTARNILEFGCGEGVLGRDLKARQPCRVVGVELDQDAAGVARERLDAVHSGDVRTLIPTLGERFDWIVGGDILEHLDEPWTFLRDLRGVATKGAHLLLSVPNVAAWPIIADLLQGRFDYVYMGITCAGHLRFFTRRTIDEMLTIAGWTRVSIDPQPYFITPEFEELKGRLDGASMPYSEADLLAPGYYVLARND